MSKQESDWLLQLHMKDLKRFEFLSHNRKGHMRWDLSWNDVPQEINLASFIDHSPPCVLVWYKTVHKFTGEETSVQQLIWLTSTPCYFGGRRYWFICPLIKNGTACKRRVGTLYMGYTYFGCRHCYELTYKSRNKNRRGAWAAFCREDDRYTAAQELFEQIERPLYKGKFTRKFKRYLKLMGIPEQAMYNRAQELGLIPSNDTDTPTNDYDTRQPTHE